MFTPSFIVQVECIDELEQMDEQKTCRLVRMKLGSEEKRLLLWNL
jgi:hypothetical protein